MAGRRRGTSNRSQQPQTPGPEEGDDLSLRRESPGQQGGGWGRSAGACKLILALHSLTDPGHSRGQGRRSTGQHKRKKAGAGLPRCCLPTLPVVCGTRHDTAGLKKCISAKTGLAPCCSHDTPSQDTWRAHTTLKGQWKKNAASTQRRSDTHP